MPITKRPVEVHDMAKYSLITQVEVSPDGQAVAYTMQTIDMEGNQYRSHLWMMPNPGGEPERFTSGPRDSQLAWSPDGRALAFVSDRTGSQQLHLVPRDGGEAQQLTWVKDGVSDPVWSPDGRYIAFISRNHPAGYTPPRADVRVITRARYKSEDSFMDDKYPHLWVVEVDTGSVRQLTDTEYGDGNPAWSPDGRYLAFSSRRTPGADFEVAGDIWRIELESGELTKLTQNHPGPVGAMSYAPDGSEIVFAGHDNHNDPGVNNTILMAMPAGGGTPEPVFSADISLGNDVLFDLTLFRSWGRPRWSGDGRWLYCLATLGGAVHVLRVNRRTGQVERVTSGHRAVYSFSLPRDGSQLFFAATSPDLVGDIFAQPLEDDYPVVLGYTPGTTLLDKRPERRLTAVNDDLLSQRQLSLPEPIVYKGAGGWDIEGWVMKPHDFDPSRKYPLVLYIHGGPANAYGYAYFNEMQLFTAQGWVVLLTNPRGSRGYGEDFAHAVHMDWGGKDYEDLMAGVDHLIAQGYVDEDNMACAGGSYGGFMVNWIVGSTDRFKVACTQRSFANRYNDIGSCDVGYMEMRAYADGPWALPEEYLSRSPIALMGNVTTPLLIIHSEEDRRCAVEQAEQVYTALKVRKQDVVFCRYWGENHNLSRGGKPVNRVDRLRRILAWFHKYLPCPAEQV